MNMELQEIEAWLDRLEKRDVNQGEATAKILDLLRGQVLANRSSIPVPNYTNGDIDGNSKQRGRRVRSIGVQDVADLRAAYERRGDMGWRSGSASPIALVIERDLRWIKLPDPFEFDSDCEYGECSEEDFAAWIEGLKDSKDVPDFSVEEGQDGLSLVAVAVSDLADKRLTEEGEHYWLSNRICGVYLSDEEAMDELRIRHYAYSSRAHVYAMPTRGSLANLVDLGPGLLDAADIALKAGGGDVE